MQYQFKCFGSFMITFDSKIVTYAAIGMAAYFFYQINIAGSNRAQKSESYHKEIYDTTSRYTYKLDPSKSKDEMNYLERYLLEKYKDRNSSIFDNHDYVKGLDVTAGISLKIGDTIYLSITPENSVYSENPAQLYILGEEGEFKKYEKDILAMKTGDSKFINDENKKQIRLKIIGIIKQEESSK